MRRMNKRDDQKPWTRGCLASQTVGGTRYKMKRRTVRCLPLLGVLAIISTAWEHSGGQVNLSWNVIDGSDNAVAVWYQNDGVRDNIWSNRYVKE
jgi:hypothetical protein